MEAEGKDERLQELEQLVDSLKKDLKQQEVSLSSTVITEAHQYKELESELNAERSAWKQESIILKTVKSKLEDTLGGKVKELESKFKSKSNDLENSRKKWEKDSAINLQKLQFSDQ